MLKDAETQGISRATLLRAKGELRVRSRRRGFGGPWEWIGPEASADAAVDAHMSPKITTHDAMSIYDKSATASIAESMSLSKVINIGSHEHLRGGDKGVLID